MRSYIYIDDECCVMSKTHMDL